MVKAAKGFITEYGSLHATWEEAKKAEKEEKERAFKKELREKLGISDNRCHEGSDWIVYTLFNPRYAPIIRQLMDKYQLGVQ